MMAKLAEKGFEMSQRSFNEIYANVPDEQRQRLATFRETHPVSTTEINGTTWEYIDSGQGDEVILLLVGGLRVADAGSRAISMLEDAYRVITPTYPALDTMAALADGLGAVLGAAGVQKAHVLAGSFGGMLAQVYVRRLPEKVDKLILSTTAVLDEESVQRYRQGIEVFSPLPSEQVAEFARNMMFEIIAPPESDHDFYRAYLDELYSYRIHKTELLSTYHALVDFADNYTLTADDLKDWSGALLILESDDDATFNEETRARVRAIYPHAQHYVFHGAGHSPGTTQRERYFKVVKTFLKGGDVQGL